MATTTSFPSPINGDDFMSQDIPEPPALLLGVVDQGSKLAIGGGSKSHKSWLLMDMALCLSSGERWLNFNTSKAGVLYLNFEIPKYRFRERLKMISAARKLPIPPNLVIWNLRGHKADPEKLPEIVWTAAKARGMGLSVVDPLYKFGGNIDENSTADIIKLFSKLDGIVENSGAGVAYGGHFSKGNQAAKNPIDRISGSGVHGRDPDAIINFTAHKEPHCYTVDLTLRYFAPVPSFVVRWECPLFTPDPNLDPNQLLRKGGAKTKLSTSDLLMVLKQEKKIANSVAFFALVEPLFHVSEKTFKKYLADLPLLPGVQHLADDQWLYTR